MEEVQRDWTPHHFVAQEIRDINPHERRFGQDRTNRVFCMIKHPAVIPTLTPRCKAGVNSFRSRDIGELKKPGKTPSLRV